MFAARLGVVLIALALAAGCGGDAEPETTEEWADSVCSSLGGWVEEIDESAQSLSGQGLDLSEDDLRGAVDRATDATDDVLDRLDELGPPPDAESGQGAEAELDELKTELREQIDGVERSLEERTETLAFLATVAAAVSVTANELQRTLDELAAAGGEVRRAVLDSEDCDVLREQIAEIGL